MKSFVLFTASLLVLGFVTLAASSETDEILKDCKITNETDAELVECLEVQGQYLHEEIDKIRSESVKNYTGVHQLIKNIRKCFTEDKKEKMPCYMRALEHRINQQLLHMNDIPFHSDATVLYYWFTSNTLTALDACDFDKNNSPAVFSCIDNFDERANEIMDSKILDIHEAYERMVELIEHHSSCYKHIRHVQVKCLRKQVDVLKMKTAEEFQQKKELLVKKLETCEISKNIIESVKDCIKPLDDKLSDLAIKMLETPRFFRAHVTRKVMTERENCIQQYPEVRKCHDAMPVKHNPRTLTKRRDEILKDCKITNETDAELVECLQVQGQYLHKEIDKIRSESVKNYTGVHQLLRNIRKCFTEDKKEKMPCYMRALEHRINQQLLHMNDIPFPSDATVLYYWFTSNTLTALDACAVDKNNSPAVFSCIDNFDRRANEMMYSKKLDIHEAYERMVELIEHHSSCYKHIRRVQAECLRKQAEVLKMKTVEDFKQHEKLLVQKLETCEISKNIIESVKDCIKPLDDKLSVLAFQMLETPKLAHVIRKVMTERENCVQQYPEVRKCHDAMRVKHNPRTLTKRRDEILKDCKITNEKDAELVECLEVQRQYLHEEIDKIRSESVKNYTGVHQLIKNIRKCFTEDKKEKMPCYMRALEHRINQQLLHMNDIPFPSDATVLYYWFTSNTLTALDACAFDKNNSPAVFSCIDNFDQRANEIMDSKKLDTHEAYKRMVDLIEYHSSCFKHIRRVQAECLHKQAEVLKMKTAEDFQQQQELLVHKLETREVSKNIIERVKDCMKPLDDKLSDLAFKMLETPKFFRAHVIRKVMTERKNCVHQSYEML